MGVESDNPSSICRKELDRHAPEMAELRHHEILCLTWNVNEIKPMPHFFETVSKRAAQGGMCAAVFALQEIEMGGSSLAMGVAKEKLQKKAQVREAMAQCTPCIIKGQDTI